MIRDINIQSAVTQTSPDLTDVIKSLNCYISFTENDRVYTFQRVFELDEPDLSKFINFDDLNKPTLIQWIENKHSNALSEVECDAIIKHEYFLNENATKLSIKTFKF